MTRPYEGMSGRTIPLRKRFDEKWLGEPNSGCWLWTGYCDKDGYGQIGVPGRGSCRANRIGYLLYRGDIPPKMLVCHSCDTPSCVNPNHFFLGTNLDNTHDYIRKGRKHVMAGEDNWNCKLTAPDVLAIRASTDTARTLSVKYGIHASYVSNIKLRKKWAHI